MMEAVEKAPLLALRHAQGERFEVPNPLVVSLSNHERSRFFSTVSMFCRREALPNLSSNKRPRPLELRQRPLVPKICLRTSLEDFL
jgi:hypothetical protein